MTTTHETRPRRLRRTATAGVAAALASLFAVTLPAAGAQAHDAQPAIGPRLQTILDRAVKSPQTTFPGVALRVRVPGHGTWAGASGTANVETGAKMRPGARFRGGSIMKTFVAVAALQLVEEGKFALDDPLTAVLPTRVTARFPDADRITVRMLLNHTSGLGEYSDARMDRTAFAHPHRRWKVSEFLDRAAAQPRFSAPGERHAYSNTNYNLLALVVEQATGKPWRAVVRERVIERARLEHTSLPEPGTTPHGRDIAHGYELIGGRLRDATNVDSSMAGAAGGHALLTNTKDLSRLLRTILAGKLFQRPETLDAMRSFVPAPGDHGEVGYGFALQRFVLPGGVELIGHMGTTAGYRAYMFHLPALRHRPRDGHHHARRPDARPRPGARAPHRRSVLTPWRPPPGAGPAAPAAGPEAGRLSRLPHLARSLDRVRVPALGMGPYPSAAAAGPAPPGHRRRSRDGHAHARGSARSVRAQSRQRLARRRAAPDVALGVAGRLPATRAAAVPDPDVDAADALRPLRGRRPRALGARHRRRARRGAAAYARAARHGVADEPGRRARARSRGPPRPAPLPQSPRARPRRSRPSARAGLRSGRRGARQAQRRRARHARRPAGARPGSHAHGPRRAGGRAPRGAGRDAGQGRAAPRRAAGRLDPAHGPAAAAHGR